GAQPRRYPDCPRPASGRPHTFTLENPERGIKSQVTVVVKAGESVTKRMAL
ncbi:hypothetical protein OUZ56_032603, partial [Daphnia magna]